MSETAPGIEMQGSGRVETDIRKWPFKLSRETLEELGSVEVPIETKRERIVGSRESWEKMLERLK